MSQYSVAGSRILGPTTQDFAGFRSGIIYSAGGDLTVVLKNMQIGDDSRAGESLANAVCAGHLASADKSFATISARELECLRWVAAGKTDWEIGTILSISSRTVKFHVNGARAKLGARTRAQAVARLLLSGLY